jgi:hypothetical protein
VTVISHLTISPLLPLLLGVALSCALLAVAEAVYVSYRLERHSKHENWHLTHVECPGSLFTLWRSLLSRQKWIFFQLITLGLGHRLQHVTQQILCPSIAIFAGNITVRAWSHGFRTYEARWNGQLVWPSLSLRNTDHCEMVCTSPSCLSSRTLFSLLPLI